MSLKPDAGPKAPPGNPHFPLSDSLRALGVMGVIAAHVSPVAINREWWGIVLWNGQVGVPALFFSTVAVSIPLVVLSHRYVELPFLRRRYTSTTAGSGHSGRRRAAGRWLSLRRRQTTPAEETADL